MEAGGDADGAFFLGLVRARGGPGVPVDPSEALRHARLAVQRGNVRGHGLSAECYDALHDTTRLVAELHAGVKAGDPGSMFLLGRSKLNAEYTAKDVAGAVPLLRTAAERADVEAQFLLAHIYDDELGVGPAPAEALKWFRAAADGGNDKAKWGVAACLMKGKGTPQDVPAALKLYRGLADGGDVQAMHLLARFHLEGIWVPRDVAAARRYFQQAVDAGRWEDGVELKWLNAKYPLFD